MKGILHIYFLFALSLFSLSGLCQEPEINKKFSEALQLKWLKVFFDSGAENWQEQWFLDGEKAGIKNTPSGMVFSAGPLANDNRSHAVLWTKKSFTGDIKLEFDYTRVDDINNAVNILYIQATGIGEPPYLKDIAAWSHLRAIPAMEKYFSHMNLLHISYAAYSLNDEINKLDYVRARQYPVRAGEDFNSTTALFPNYENTGLFKPGVKYHFTVIKSGNDLFMKIENQEGSKLFHWDTVKFSAITEGRIGIRHMWKRCSQYANVQVSVIK